MAARSKVNNKVRLVGKIIYIRINTKTATVVVDTSAPDSKRNNFPSAIAFEKVLDLVKDYKVGDYVLIDATLQSNDIKKVDLPPRTIAINHIHKVNPESERYRPVNLVDLYGRLIYTEKITDNKAKATIAVSANKRNYITIYLETEDTDKINEFVESNSKFVHLWGQILTSKTLTKEGTHQYFDKITVSGFRVLR